MIKLENSLNFAKQLDQLDSLSEYRNLFHIPKDSHNNDLIYFCGNSLGLQPKSTKSFIDKEMKDWANLGVKGWSNAKNPWLEYHSYLTNEMANIVGAKPLEVVVMNTLTVNLHLMMVSFYKPTDTKFKIILEADSFPSDVYAVESQLIHHGYNANDGIILWETKNVENKYQELENIFLENKNEIALVLIGGVNYYTGEYFNLKKITEIGHKYKSIVGFDCAHAAGNVQLNLNKVGADFAIWCSYKYLNSGPGSLSGCFVHERHAYNNDLNRFRGWWGNDLNNRFNMREPFQTIPGADGWQISTPTILSMAAIKASLEIFKEVGMKKLCEKSTLLTNYLEFLLLDLNSSKINIITPTESLSRGCQISIEITDADKKFHKSLTDLGVITDWRDPNVIRCAPTPLYNSFVEVYLFVEKLKLLI
ncbi:kynureninase [Flavobacteriaceae bacterium]|nr:kynureninase [Flavobacteriaceae bacterium]